MYLKKYHFLEYQYMLIYQLDAFVFEDKLDYFCELGYDYIGIPVPDYTDTNVSTKVVNIIQSYTGVVDKVVWRK